MSLLHVISPIRRTVCYQLRPLGVRNIKHRGVSETNLKVCSVLFVNWFARNVLFIYSFVRRTGCCIQCIKWEEQTTPHYFFFSSCLCDQQQLSLQDLFLALVLKTFQLSSRHLIFPECPVSCWIGSRWHWTSQCCSQKTVYSERDILEQMQNQIQTVSSLLQLYLFPPSKHLVCSQLSYVICNSNQGWFCWHQYGHTRLKQVLDQALKHQNLKIQ